MAFDAKVIFAVTEKVTKEWTRQRKLEERRVRSVRSREYIYSDRVYCTDVADQILPGAYQHASGDGRHSVSTRQFFYACRDQFRERTGRELQWKYFSNTLLVQYMNRHRDDPEVASWRVTADPRGTLQIPNAAHEVVIPVGTLQIDDHLAEAELPIDPFAIEAELPFQWPSLAAGQRYQAVLYIEKEGFDPLMQEARIGERFDLAIISCKGQSVVAARKYVDHVCAALGGVPLLIAHDFDKAGFEISQRLTTVSDWAEANNRVTYDFKNTINFTDLGLRLADVEQYGLKPERCGFTGRFASDSICTEAEKAYLRSGRRVELNAFTAPQFIEWLEAKLTERLGSARMVPHDDDVLADAWQRALVVSQLNAAIKEILGGIVERARAAAVPPQLRERLAARMEGEEGAWDEVLYKLVVEASASSI